MLKLTKKIIYRTQIFEKFIRFRNKKGSINEHAQKLICRYKIDINNTIKIAGNFKSNH